MNKKILIGSLALMLVTISFASAVNTNNEKKESPLWKIRTKRAIDEKLSKMLENIKTRFLGERIFFHQFKWLKNNLGDNSDSGNITVWQKICTYLHPICVVS